MRHNVNASSASQEQFEISDLNRVQRMKARGSYDRDTIYRILDEALVCHVGVAQDGAAIVIPMAFAREDDSLLLHGSSASRLLRLASSIPVCVTATLIDGLVLARCAYNHSMNYRSAVLFGEATIISDEAEKLRALRALTNRLSYGRWDALRPPTDGELNSTKVLRFVPTSGSAKVRVGPPADFPADTTWDVWAGEVPLITTTGTPVPADGVSSRIGYPETEK